MERVAGAKPQYSTIKRRRLRPKGAVLRLRRRAEVFKGFPTLDTARGPWFRAGRARRRGFAPRAG